MRVVRSLLNVTLIVSLFFVGQAVGWQKGFHAYSTGLKFKNELTAQYEAVWEDLDLGFKRLLTCEYLAMTHPQVYLNLVDLTKVPISIAYGPFDYDFYAAADIKKQLIILGPGYFEETRLMRASIMSHELLHLAGLGGHEEKLNTKTDNVYITTNACYPELPPE